ncbi:MAG: hypothetical protein LJE62_15575 [Silicimonas sp.]|nr:hypothetical protein [Silicimonas sp.]
MDLSVINDAARAAHLVGLALGFGVAIMADLCAARSLFRPLQDHEFDDLHRFHRTVAFGLTLFWASGLVLLWLRTGFAPENFSPKLITKLCVVALLTVNAYLIGRIGLPTLMAWAGCRFGALPMAHRLRLAALAGLSGAGWISALTLGVFSAMKTFEWDVLSEIIGAIYVTFLIAALAAAFLSPLLNFALERFRSA